VKLLLVAALLGSASASADGFAHRLELGGGTAFPLAVDAEATLWLGDYVAIEAAIGVMPGPYVDAINKTAVALGAYDDTTAELIAAALDTAIIARTDVAIAPFRFPLAFDLGYSLAALGGGVGGATAVEAVTGEQVRADTGNDIPMHSTVHFVQIGAAWRFTLRPSLILKVSLEYTQPFASGSSIDVSGRTPQAQARIDKASTELDSYLNETYTSYVKSPVIGVSLRWRPR
jgi:hypothetical protein